MPANEGCFRPVSFLLPEGSLVNARPPRPVSAGNVETWQRIVDVVLGALARALPTSVPAASASTMDNVSIGGHDPFRRGAFAFYETVGGGSGLVREWEFLAPTTVTVIADRRRRAAPPAGRAARLTSAREAPRWSFRRKSPCTSKKETSSPWRAGGRRLGHAGS